MTRQRVSHLMVLRATSHDVVGLANTPNPMDLFLQFFFLLRTMAAPSLITGLLRLIPNRERC